MPIYAYKCAACGYAKDALQKLSDAPLTTCPACGAEAFSKQLTAAGFQLKGSGWYVTDFRDNGAAGKPAADGAKPDDGAKPADATPTAGAAKPDAAKSETASSAPALAASAPTPSPAPSPAPAPAAKAAD